MKNHNETQGARTWKLPLVTLVVNNEPLYPCDELIHVIEYSAVQALQSKLEKAEIEKRIEEGIADLRKVIGE